MTNPTDDAIEATAREIDTVLHGSASEPRYRKIYPALQRMITANEDE